MSALAQYKPLCQAEFLMAVVVAIFRSRERSERYELRIFNLQKERS